MITISVTYTDPLQIENLKDLPFNFKFIDILSKKGKKEGWKLKNYYGAHLDPFAVVTTEDKLLTVFYSEADNVIESLIKYLKNYGTSSKSN